MNVYSELWELLCPAKEAPFAVCFGTITATEPPAVTVAGQVITSGLVWPKGGKPAEKDRGEEVALLPLADGFLVLFQVEGGNT